MLRQTVMHVNAIWWHFSKLIFRLLLEAEDTKKGEKWKADTITSVLKAIWSYGGLGECTVAHKINPLYSNSTWEIKSPSLPNVTGGQHFLSLGVVPWIKIPALHSWLYCSSKSFCFSPLFTALQLWFWGEQSLGKGPVSQCAETPP